MRIEERFTRQSDEDKVMIGEMIDSVMRTDFGKLFKIMVDNLKVMEVSSSRNSNVSADRILGRLEAYDSLMADILGFIEEKNKLQEPLPEQDPESELANEQIAPLRGGTV